MQDKGLYYAYWVALLTVTLVGMGAILVRFTEGLAVTNLSNFVPWGLWVAFYIYFIGLSAGSFLLSTLIYVFGVKRFEAVGRLAVFTALISLVAGLAFVWVDIGHMERFYTVFYNINATSVLEWEIFLYNFYVVILLAELWLLLRRDFIRAGEGEGLAAQICRLLALGSNDVSPDSVKRDMGLVRILGAVGIPVAIGVHGGTGAIFAVVAARPYWHSGLFPIVFLVSALASGGALLAFLAAFFTKEGRRDRALVPTLGKLVGGLLALDLLLLASEFLVGLYGNIPEDMAAYNAITQGPYWWVFWAVQLGLGAALPLLIIFNGRTNVSPTWVGSACLLVVAGVLGVRWNIVNPGFSGQQIEGLGSAVLPTPRAFPITRLPSQLPEPTQWFFILGTLVFIGAVSVIFFHLLRQLREQRAGVLARSGAALGLLALILGSLWFIANNIPMSTAAAIGPSLTAILPIPKEYAATRFSSAYTPSLIEWLASAGIIGLAVTLFTLGIRLLPMEGEPVKEGAWHVRP
ncbi:MAG: polysulfide reductase NrfD [Chloroflexi bacterium]|nr:polysulfide reductase NrfD [Chloroflexota bacterium]MBI5955483.1 polysulfide reductase NrfD [Chloroflexota bacterium]